jgi:lysozyme
MKLNAEGVALIKSYESCRLTAYICPGGIWTIGYGHTGAEVHDGLSITPQEAENLLAVDLLTFDATVARLCPRATAAQHAALTSLCFNIGPAAFARSSVVRLHNADKFAEAAQAFALWNKAKGRVIPGLVARRAQEAALYLSEQPLSAAAASGERVLTSSRTLAGTAIGSTAAAAATFGELADAFKEWRSGLAELLPYFHEVRWVLLVMTLLGLAVAAYARWSDRREGRS